MSAPPGSGPRGDAAPVPARVGVSRDPAPETGTGRTEKRTYDPLADVPPEDRHLYHKDGAYRLDMSHQDWFRLTGNCGVCGEHQTWCTCESCPCGHGSGSSHA